MINVGEETVGRIVPGKLECSVNGHRDMFVADSDLVVKLNKQLEEARQTQRDRRVKYILPAFRSVVSEFKATFETPVTKCYMYWRDFDYLCEAYNEERLTLLSDDGVYPRERVSSCSDSVMIDGICCKKGCDRKEAELNLHSFE